VAKVPLVPTELNVLVNKRFYDYLGRDSRATLSGIVQVTEGQIIEIEVYLNCITAPNTIAEVLEWRTKPNIWCDDVFGQRYSEGTKYSCVFLANPRLFDEKTRELKLEYAYAGGDEVKVRGWRVRGFGPFIWGSYGEFVTKTNAAAKKEIWLKLVTEKR
jgi:hypothetical protein